MKTYSINHNRYPDKEKELINLVAKPWLEKQIKKVEAKGDEEKKEKYTGIVPESLTIEYPSAIFRKKGYFHSTILARDHGLCFPDPKVKLLPFEEFVHHVDPDNKTFIKVTYNMINKDLIEKFCKEAEEYPESTTYQLFKYKIQGHTRLALFVYSPYKESNLDEIFELLFKGYAIREIDGHVIQRSDVNYPRIKQRYVRDYCTGFITISDALFENEKTEIDVYNIKLIQDIVNPHEFKYDGYYFYDAEKTYNG